MPNKAAPKGLKGKTGGVSNKWWLLGGAVGGGLFYLHMRNSAAPTDPTAAPTDPNAAAATDPYANDPYGYDPYAGYGGASFGSGGGSNGIPDWTGLTDAIASGIQQGDSGGTSDPTGGDGNGSGAGSSGGSVHHATDKHWMHEAIKALEDQGYTKSEATAAITAYITGAPMTQQQIHAAQTAVGKIGAPPKTPPAIEHAHPKNTGHHGHGARSTAHSHGGAAHKHAGGNKPHSHPKKKKKPAHH